MSDSKLSVPAPNNWSSCLPIIVVSGHSRVNKGLPLPAHVEHVQPGHGAELLPPQSVTRHDIGLAVWERQQPLVRIVQRGVVTFVLRLLPIKHTVVWRHETNRRRNAQLYEYRDFIELRSSLGFYLFFFFNATIRCFSNKLTSLVHFSLCLQTKKNIFQCCHGNPIVDNSQIGLTVQLREQAYEKQTNERLAAGPLPLQWKAESQRRRNNLFRFCLGGVCFQMSK